MSRRNLIGMAAALAAAVATSWAGSARADCTSSDGTPQAPADGATIVCDDSQPNPFPDSVGGGANQLDVEILPNASIEAGAGDDGINVGDDSTIDHDGGNVSGDTSGISADDDNLITVSGDVSLGLPLVEGRDGSAFNLENRNTVTVTSDLGVVRSTDGNGFEFDNGNVIDNAADIELSNDMFDGFNGENNNTIDNSGDITSLEPGFPQVEDGFDLEDDNSVTSAEGGAGIGIIAAEYGYNVNNRNTIDNRSDIDAGDGGFFALSNNSITNSGRVVVDLGGYGLDVDNENTIRNSGTISSDLRLAADGILAVNGNVIENSGTILGDGSGITAEIGNDITNSDFIRGNLNALKLTDSNNVVNSGTIQSTQANAIELLGTGNDVMNTGLIVGAEGGVASLGGGTVVENRGTINGLEGPSVEFTSDSGTNTLTLGTGSVLEGIVDGSDSGGATDNLFLEGTGFEDDSIVDFENLTMQGADWELSGALEIVDTQIDSGLLEINGTLTGTDVTVDGGILGGNGTIDADVVNSPLLGGDDSVVAPGTSIGTLFIDGNYTQGPNGVLLIEVDEKGNSDRLDVTGTANLGGTLLIDSEADGLGDFVDVAVLADTINGFFDQVVAPNRGIAGAVLGTSGLLESVLVGVASPSSLDTRVDAALDGGFLFTSNLTNRLQGVRNGTATASSHVGAVAPLLASTDGSLAASLATQLAGFSGPTRPIKTEGGPGLWVRGVGWYGERDAESDVLGYDYTLAGVVVGGDWAIGETGFVVGAGFNYTHAWSDVDSNSSENDADNYLFGAYLGYDRDNYFFDVAIGGGFSNYDSDRSVSVNGIPTRAKADFDGTSFAVRAAGGMDFAIGELFTVRPLLSLDYVWVSQDGYTESGAGLGNLALDDTNPQALKLQGLVALTQSYAIGNDMKLIPELRTGVVGQFALGDRDVDAALPAVGATGVLAGNDSHEVRAALGGGVTLQMGSGLSAYVDLGGELGSDTRNGTATGGIRFIF